jgi:hypothetical protein
MKKVILFMVAIFLLSTSYVVYRSINEKTGLDSKNIKSVKVSHSKSHSANKVTGLYGH